MAIDWWCWRLTLCSILLIVHNVVSAKESKIHNFMANPTGQLRTEEVEMDSFKCKFTYKCVGGTGEGWEMILEKTSSGFHCVIERPEQSSYLFFMMFEASVEGSKLKRVEPYVEWFRCDTLHAIRAAECRMDNAKRMLHEDEYKVVGNKVKSQSAFKSNLATLALIAEDN